MTAAALVVTGLTEGRGAVMIKGRKDVAAMWISKDGERTVADNGVQIFRENRAGVQTDGDIAGTKISGSRNQK